MAEDDNAGGAGGSEAASTSSTRSGRRTRAAAGGEDPRDKQIRELTARLARLEQGPVAGPQTPKLSKTLDTVEPDDVDEAIEAINGALATNDWAALQDGYPELTEAIRRNNAYRRVGDERHSLRVAKKYLESRHGIDASAEEHGGRGKQPVRGDAD